MGDTFLYIIRRQLYKEINDQLNQLNLDFDNSLYIRVSINQIWRLLYIEERQQIALEILKHET